MEKYKILNGIWKNYYIDYDEWHPIHHSLIYDNNGEIVAKTNNNGGYNNTEYHYNESSRRKEEFRFSVKNKTVKYKSLGHWRECDIEFCHNNYPFIMPSTTENVSWKKKVKNAYINDVPEKFTGILDFKIWGNSRKLYLYFTDITNLKKYVLKVTNKSRYMDNRENVNFITNGNLSSVYEIYKSNDSKTSPSVLNAKIVSEEIYFDFSSKFIKQNRGKFIVRELDVCTGEIICPKCNYDGDLKEDGNFVGTPNILSVLTGAHLIKVETNSYIQKNCNLISIENPEKRILEILNIDFKYDNEFFNERIVYNNQTSIKCRKCNQIIIDDEIDCIDYLKDNLAINGNYEINGFLKPYEILNKVKIL